jgi:hypothetical protein
MSSEFISTPQRRIVHTLYEYCASFLRTVRSSSSIPLGAADIPKLVIDALSSPTATPSSSPHDSSTSWGPLDFLKHAGWPDDTTPIPSTSSYSSATTTIVPIVANRLSLPKNLVKVPMLDVLPPAIAATYTEAASSDLLRPAAVVQYLNEVRPLKRPRVGGLRSEYVKAVSLLLGESMVDFTSQPKAVNGVFAVGKDDTSDRLIIDAQPANRCFIDSPHIALPNPSHLVQLRVPKGRRMYVGKSDLSDYYHHQALPEWMTPYFCLPPLSVDELASIGIESQVPLYPKCLTLPMGFSHAVFIGESAHQYVIYSTGAFNKDDDLLSLTSSEVTHDRAIHGIVIDDFFIFCLDQALATRLMNLVFDAYRRVGFVVKPSKVVLPTCSPVKVIGFDIDGTRGTISLPLESMTTLVKSTLAVLRVPTVSGTLLSHIIGRWTWVMMLRRPTLCLLQHVYRYCTVAAGRPFTLWPSVRRELCSLLTMLPLLSVRLDAPFFHRAVASDASQLASGVVSTPLTPQLHSQLWPLCSTRHHASLQAVVNAEHKRLAPSTTPPTSTPPLELSVPSSPTTMYDDFYTTVSSQPWRTLISKPWSGLEHINALELRAVLLAVHWLLSYPTSLCRRVYLLVDSTVTFFTLWKGRSSSPHLLLILRKINALLLAGSITLLPGWLPSEVNPADAPSRLAA